jgi:hypothetical protein
MLVWVCHTRLVAVTNRVIRLVGFSIEVVLTRLIQEAGDGRLI